MNPGAKLTCAIAVMLAAVACSSKSPTEPTPVEILDQAYLLACQSWAPATPPVTRTLVDAKVRGDGEKVTEADLETLRQKGGVIVHEFAAGRMVRVAIDVDRLLPLHRPGPLSPGDFLAHARTVPNPGSFKVSLIVSLQQPTTDADIAAAVNLGATITHRYTVINGYALEIEDAKVAQLRALPGVVTASLVNIGCLT